MQHDQASKNYKYSLRSVAMSVDILRVLMQQLTFVCFALWSGLVYFFYLFYCPFYGHSIENLCTLESNQRMNNIHKPELSHEKTKRYRKKATYIHTVRSITLSILVRHSFYLRYIFTKWSVMLFSI